MTSFVYTPETEKCKKIKVKSTKHIDKRWKKNSSEFDGNIYYHCIYLFRYNWQKLHDFSSYSKNNFYKKRWESFLTGTFVRTINIYKEFIFFQSTLHMVEDIKKILSLKKQNIRIFHLQFLQFFKMTPIRLAHWKNNGEERPQRN